MQMLGQIRQNSRFLFLLRVQKLMRQFERIRNESNYTANNWKKLLIIKWPILLRLMHLLGMRQNLQLSFFLNLQKTFQVSSKKKVKTEVLVNFKKLWEKFSEVIKFWKDKWKESLYFIFKSTKKSLKSDNYKWIILRLGLWVETFPRK